MVTRWSVVWALLVVLASRAAAAGGEQEIRRGGYLVRITGCHDCHTPFKAEPGRPPAPDMSRMLSGHPEGAPDPAAKPGEGDLGVIGPTFTSFAMPFGVVYAANLTPDRQTGLGAWTEKMFVQTMRTGRVHGIPSARPILPPMPWQNLQGASDEDLRAIFAYLRSIPAVRNKVPAPKVAPEVIAKMTEAAGAPPHPSRN